MPGASDVELCLRRSVRMGGGTVGMKLYDLYPCWFAGRDNYILRLVGDGEICLSTIEWRKMHTVVNIFVC